MILEESILRKITPVIINSFNQPTYLKNIVTKFIQNKLENIFILDNNSTYAPIFDLYKELSKIGITILYYNENKGPRYFHLSKFFERYFKNIPHLYTDPDIDFEILSPDFLLKLSSISEEYTLAKVGCALELPKKNEVINDLIYIKEINSHYTINDWESQFWLNSLGNNLYKSNVDTTLHYFNPKFYSGDFFNAIRVAGVGFTVKHLPWYKNNRVPEKERKFYADLQQWSNYSTN